MRETRSELSPAPLRRRSATMRRADDHEMPVHDAYAVTAAPRLPFLALRGAYSTFAVMSDHDGAIRLFDSSPPSPFNQQARDNETQAVERSAVKRGDKRQMFSAHVTPPFATPTAVRTLVTSSSAGGGANRPVRYATGENPSLGRRGRQVAAGRSGATRDSGDMPQCLWKVRQRWE